MPIIAPKQRVDSPAATPLPGGLFSQVSPIEDSSVRWENGVTWEDVERAQLGVIGQWQRPGTVPGLPKTLTDPKGLALESQAPLTVYAAFRTTPLDHSAEEATQVAASRLLAQEEHAVEAALWTGAPGRGLGLAKVRSYAPKGAGGKLDLAQGLAVLEHYAAQYGFQPILHIPRRLASLMASAKLVKEARGGGFATRLGTPVVVGAGYADEMQIVATGPILIYRGSAFTSTAGDGGFNQDQNELTGVAERQYVLGFNEWDAFRVTVDAGIPQLDLKAAEK
nr:MAG TPA: hypothetical protein [Caudoviricetes sp.]